MTASKHAGFGTIVRVKTGQAIQDAIDKAASRGGGIVFLPAGTYSLEAGLKMRSNVMLQGEGRATLLKRSSLAETPLAEDAAEGSVRVAVKDAGAFRAGVEVAIRELNPNGPIRDMARIRKVQGNKVWLETPLVCNYAVSRKATLFNAFPVIFGREVENVIVQNLAVDGTRPENESPSSGECEGIQFTDCAGCKVLDCIAFNCGGFGISCSGGENITFRGCESYGNVWHGFHVGLGKTTGSARCAIENCYAHHNDWVGIYICWNVTESVFLGNHLSDNKLHGLLIGPFDNRNLIANNVISNNGESGIMVARRAHPCQSNTFVNNILCDNGKPGVTPAVTIESPKEGRYEHFLFARNMIIETRKVQGPGAAAFFIDEQTDHIALADNYLQGTWRSLADNRSMGGHNSIK
ncbi:MAG: hypothetical protein GX608_02685 [Lentisphaerae bacterium]|nr:hypothetical protein [Lentisphaerota bacterium]